MQQPEKDDNEDDNDNENDNEDEELKLSEYYQNRLKKIEQLKEDVIVLERTKKIVICEVDKQFKVKIFIENDYPSRISFPMLNAYVICKKIGGSYRKIYSVFWVPCDEACGVFHVEDGPEFEATLKVINFFDGSGFLSTNTEGTMESIMNWGSSKNYDYDSD